MALAQRATAWSVMTFGVIAGVYTLILFSILPKFQDTFSQLEVTLPPLTRLIIAISEWSRQHGVLYAGVWGLGLAAYLWAKRTLGPLAFRCLVMTALALSLSAILIGLFLPS